MRQLVGHSGPVYSTSFSPDNTSLLSASEDGTSMYNNTQYPTMCKIIIVRIFNVSVHYNQTVLRCKTNELQISSLLLVFVFQFGCGVYRRSLRWSVSKATTIQSGVCSLGEYSRTLCWMGYILTHTHTPHARTHTTHTHTRHTHILTHTLTNTHTQYTHTLSCYPCMILCRFV